MAIDLDMLIVAENKIGIGAIDKFGHVEMTEVRVKEILFDAYGDSCGR